MGIDLRRAHVFVAELLLDRSDIHATLQEVRNEGVPHRMAGSRFVNPRFSYCPVIEIQILYAEPNTLHQPQPRSVKQATGHPMSEWIMQVDISGDVEIGGEAP
jgi:hypothetical protein